MNPFTSAVVQSMIELGLQQRHLERLIAVYSQRATDLVTAMHEYLPDSVVFEEPRGGFFLWMQLPDGMNAKSFRKAAKTHWVNFQPGFNFSASGGFSNFIRLCFVYYSSESLREGTKRLGEVMLRSRKESSK